MQRLLTAIGNLPSAVSRQPQNVNCQFFRSAKPWSIVNYPVIHVAGTNGKGSTSHLIASCLAAAGYKVGLYTSPHLVSFCERVRVIENKAPRLIPEEYVARFVEQHQALFAELQPSFFEITTAMAFCWLAEQQVDVAVIEVGLGGLLDATNIVSPVLTVITNIGLDHTDLLGHTLAEIATQKAGIMKPGVPCVIGETHPETEQVFLDRARECGIVGEGLETTDCRIWFADRCGFLRKQRLRVAPDCQLKGDYQQKNMQTAYVALMALMQSPINPQSAINGPYGDSRSEELSIRQSSIAEGFARVVTYTGLRGRWETLATSPLTICDTGHNSHGVATYVGQLNAICNRHSSTARQKCQMSNVNGQLHVVFGMVADKDIDDVLRLLPADATYYFTQPDSHRALPAETLAGKWLVLHPDSRVRSFSRIADALHAAQTDASPDDCIFIGGSNYVVGEAIKYYESVPLSEKMIKWEMIK